MQNNSHLSAAGQPQLQFWPLNKMSKNWESVRVIGLHEAIGTIIALFFPCFCVFSLKFYGFLEELLFFL